MEKLAGFPSLGYAMHKVDAGHMFVSHFGIDTHHLRMIECGNEGQHMTGSRIVEIGPRFIGLGFQGKFQIIFLI